MTYVTNIPKAKAEAVKEPKIPLTLGDAHSEICSKLMFQKVILLDMLFIVT